MKQSERRNSVRRDRIHRLRGGHRIKTRTRASESRPDRAGSSGAPSVEPSHVHIRPPWARPRPRRSVASIHTTRGCPTSLGNLVFCFDAIVLFWAVRFVPVGRTFSIRVISCRRSYPPPAFRGVKRSPTSKPRSPREGVTPPARKSADRGAPARQGAGSYPAPTSATVSRQSETA